MSIVAQRTQSNNTQNPAYLTIPVGQEECWNSRRPERQSSSKPEGHHHQGVVLKDTGWELWARCLACLLSLCPPVTLNWFMYWLHVIPLLPSLAAVEHRASSITEATRQLGRPHRETKGTFTRYQVCEPQAGLEKHCGIETSFLRRYHHGQ